MPGFRPGLALGVVLGTLNLAAAGSASAEPWRVDPTLSVDATLTNNVDLAPSGSRQSDFYMQISPGFNVSGSGSHARISGSVSLPILLYARTGAENNSVYPTISLTGNAELIDRLLFVDAAASVSPQFLTPFGAKPTSLGTNTDNRYTSQSYRLSPYFKGSVGTDVTYELRDDNIWNLLNNTPQSIDGTAINTNNSYTNVVTGTIVRDPSPLGWQVDYNRSDVRFDTQDAELSELGRLRLLYQPERALELGVSGGYERNEFSLSSYRGAIYGTGVKWHPDPRFSADGFWEHRYFGSSYGLKVDYRTELTVWALNSSRNVTSYPQSLATLPGGGDVPGLLNQLFSSRIADPVERQRIVDQLIRDRGLPNTLGNPVTLYSQQITLEEQTNATFGVLGARNSIFANVYYLHTQPIAGSGNPLPPELAGISSYKQVGASLAWNYRITPLYSLATTVDWSRTRGDVQVVLADGSSIAPNTNQGSIRAIVTAPISPLSTAYAGVRYQVFNSNVGSDYNEAAIFVGMTYVFH